MAKRTPEQKAKIEQEMAERWGSGRPGRRRNASKEEVVEVVEALNEATVAEAKFVDPLPMEDARDLIEAARKDMVDFENMTPEQVFETMTKHSALVLRLTQARMIRALKNTTNDDPRVRSAELEVVERLAPVEEMTREGMIQLAQALGLNQAKPKLLNAAKSDATPLALPVSTADWEKEFGKADNKPAN